MTPALPDPSQTLKAIDFYLQLAYPAEPSVTVRKLLDGLRMWSGGFYDAPAFARDDKSGGPTRYSLRLGNQHYPHMKLVLEPAPDGAQYLFKADTHDRHVCPPPGSREHEAFAALMRRNQSIAEQVEAAWAADGLPTFKTYLQQDLARRAAAAATAATEASSATVPAGGAART